MSAQSYDGATPLARMSDGRCPECGGYPQEHDGWGGPNGCTLTDNGVAQRIAQYRKAQDA
jgi:hypothetical protein